MKSWDELSRKEQLAATHYDFYKDVHGIRPRWMNYDAMTEEQLEKELEQLERESDIQRIEEEKMQKECIAKFEQCVTDTIAMGAKDRATALRWIMDASDANGDWDYFCYLNGLPYNHFDEVVA